MSAGLTRRRRASSPARRAATRRLVAPASRLRDRGVPRCCSSLLPVGAASSSPRSPTATAASRSATSRRFFRPSLMRESFWNSLYVAGMTVVLASLIAVPLAYFTVRFQFRGAVADPDARRAAADHAAVRRRGGDAADLRPLGLGQPAANDSFGFTHSVHGGAERRDLRRGLHYFPFILLNLSSRCATSTARWRNRRRTSAPRAGGCSARIVFPLALPGYVAGAALVFVKVFDDLGTPLVLNVTNMLAPQAYLRITSVGIEDPIGYVISVIMIAFSIARYGLSARVLKGKRLRDPAARRRRRLRGASSRRRQARRSRTAGSALVLLLVLSPHLGILLLSFATVWSFSRAARRLHARALRDGVRATRTGMIGNTLLYCGAGRR